MLGSKRDAYLKRFGLMSMQNQYEPIMQAYHLPSPYDANFFSYLWSECINESAAKKDLRSLEYKHARVEGEYCAPVTGFK